MLTIRMQRVGRKHAPHFRVVVCEHTIGPKAGKYLEKLGSYNTKTKERVLDEERIKYWMSQGAKPSETMHNMLISAGVIKGEKINVLPKRKIFERLEAEKKKQEDKTESEKSTDLPAQAENKSVGEQKTEEDATKTTKGEGEKPAEEQSAPAEEEKKEEPPVS